MDCRKFQRNLEDYLEGGMDFPGRFGMERHARQCFGCGNELAGAQKLSGLVRNFKRASAPPDFESAVLGRIRASGERSRFWTLRRFWIYGFDNPSWRRMAFGASVLAFLCAGVFVSAQWIIRENPPADNAGSGRQTAIAAAVPGTGDESVAGSLEPSPELEAAGTAISGPVMSTSSRTRIANELEDGFSGQIEPSEYMDYVVPGPGNRPIVVRLPKTIRIEYGQLSEEYFIRNVSH